MRLVRSNNGEGREVIAYANERIEAVKRQLTSLGLDERSSDVMRGRIVELQKLIEAVNNAGEDHV